ncbi:MAG: DUF4440 domain-containing protein [Gammaproteobacteria bacterium]
MKIAATMMLLPLSVGMAFAETPTVVDAYAIANQSNAAWAKNYSAGDANMVAGAYTGDALLVPPAAEPVSGRDAIKNYWTDRMADGQKIYVRVESANVRGNSLIESGVWSVMVTNVYGQSAYGGGDFTRIFDKQQDGSWKIRLETWTPTAARNAYDARVSME